MSLELGQPADGDQATSAEDPEEASQSGTTSAADTPNAYADSGASPAPSFSAVWGTTDASGASESSTTADTSDDAGDLDDSEDSDDSEPSTAGPRTIQGTVVDSNTADTSGTSETANAPEASSAPDDTEDPAASTASEDSIAPDALDAHEASDAADAPVAVQDPDEPGTSGASGAAGLAADTDALGSPADDEADDDASGAAEPAAVSVPAQAVPEDVTDRPSAVGNPGAVGNTAVGLADGEATTVPESSATGGRASVAARLDAAAGDLDGPLLGDVEGLRASWQQIQIGFVDDPHEAVVDAAVLVEHAAQTLIDALQQRQRLLRSLWDRNSSLEGLGSPPAGSPAPAQAADRSRPPGDIPDTEDFRLLIQRYRTMFNEICRP